MVAVTQRIPNFLGGVSQQVDERLFPGQVRKALNSYPDPTFGLMKRPGGRFVSRLKDGAGELISPNTFDNGAWFSIFRDGNERYVGVLNNGVINIWSLLDGSKKTVNHTGSSTQYLTGGKNDFNFLTVNDYTFITNKTTVVKELAPPTYTPRTHATLRLTEVEYSAEYVVTINGTEYKTLTRNADSSVGASDPAKKVLNADDVLAALKTAITAPGVTVTQIGTSLELVSSTSMTVTGKGGQSGEALKVYQDTVESVAQLAKETTNGRIVAITTPAANASTVFVEFKANDGIKGPGIWEETLKPGISQGLDPSTMPHELIRNADGTFTVRPATWEPRLVGDDESNAHPSFVGSNISQLFFYNNRLGFLTQDNVSMSQAGEYFNFYTVTAATVIGSDPVDISCSSIKPAVLHAVLPSAQGLLLFSQYQQFLMAADQGVWTPTTVTIKAIANYECDPSVQPVDLGTTSVFTSKNPNYTRVFEMSTRGQEENPIVVDQSKIVSEWIPTNQDQLVSSPQNTLVTLASRDSHTLYMFRYYDEGSERKMAAWVNWQLSGNIQHHSIVNDTLYSVTKQIDSYVIQEYQLVQSPKTSGLISSTGGRVDPYMDMWSEVSGTYSPTSYYTRYYLPFGVEPHKKICIVYGGSSNNLFGNSGLVNYPTAQTDANGPYVEVFGDLSGTTAFIGYTFLYEVDLPRLYYNVDQRVDYTASLVMSRYKFYVGQGSDLGFQIRTYGRPDWVDACGAKAANFYKANDTPIEAYNLYTVPIMQRTENFSMKITSELPFPVSLVSMVWEGQYSPKYYTRR